MISHKKRAQVQPQRPASRALHGSCPYAQVGPYIKVGAKQGFQTKLYRVEHITEVIVASSSLV